MAARFPILPARREVTFLSNTDALGRWNPLFGLFVISIRMSSSTLNESQSDLRPAFSAARSTACWPKATPTSPFPPQPHHSVTCVDYVRLSHPQLERITIDHTSCARSTRTIYYIKNRNHGGRRSNPRFGCHIIRDRDPRRNEESIRCRSGCRRTSRSISGGCRTPANS